MGASGTKPGEERESPIRFRDVLRIRSFAVLFGAEAQSIVGDQLARVALSVLVFDKTGSAPATAATYAATLLPALIGGLVLGGVGDRVPRRAVMVGCDLLRAGLFVLTALRFVPLPVVIAIFMVAVFLGPAFAAAEVSTLAVRLTSEQFRAGAALRLMTSQAAQVGGFALGGILVAALDPRGALLVDAMTYVLSAVLVGSLLRGRTSSRPEPAAEPVAHSPGGRTSPAAERFAGLWGDRRIRALIALSLLAGFFVVPEGLAVPFGSSVGADTVEIGLLLASGALGGALGAALLVRFVRPARRGFVANWMAVGCGLPLAVTALAPHWPLAIVLWMLSGLLAAYIIEATTVVVQAIPDQRRSRLVGIVGALLLSAQGAGLLIFGVVTRVMSPAHSIALAGLIGSACALALVLGPLRHRPAYRAAHRQAPGRSGELHRSAHQAATRRELFASTGEKVSPQSKYR